jgi:hypothetical protein
MQASADLAQHHARLLRPEHIELVVTQDLLVPLWRAGVLSGRSYDVFVAQLPARELQARLDAAAQMIPGATGWSDFRVDASWQKDEWAALAEARARVTSHTEIHRVLQAAGLAVHLVPWCMPAVQPARRARAGQPPTLAFAASALPRKGACEVAAVARRLAARVLILGTPPSQVQAWAGVNWSAPGYGSHWLAQTDVVVLPAYIEHQPRAALQALAAGIPVVASPACGLGLQPGVRQAPAGNVDALEQAVRQALADASVDA